MDNPLQAFRIYNEEMLNLHRGQGIELFWRDSVTVPTENEYLLMISNKTGGLFRLAARLMQSASSTKHDVLPLTDLIGLIFQVRDDYNNLCSEQVSPYFRTSSHQSRVLINSSRWLQPKGFVKT